MPEIGTQTRQPEGLPIAIPVETRPVFNVRRFIPILIVILCVFVAFINQGDVSGVNSAVTINDENHDIEPPYECKPEDATEKIVQGNYIEQFANLKVVNNNICSSDVNSCASIGWINVNPSKPTPGDDVFNVPIKIYYWMENPPKPRYKHSWAIIRPDALDTGNKIPRYRLNMVALNSNTNGIVEWDSKNHNQEEALLLSSRLGGQYTLTRMQASYNTMFGLGGFLQTKCIHRGPYKKFESYIYDCIKSHNSSAIAKWDIHYISNCFGPFDPISEVHYTVWFEKGCESKSMLFKNPV